MVASIPIKATHIMKMNFLRNNLLPSALVAATVIGIAAPEANALSLTGDISIGGNVRWTNNSSNRHTFDFFSGTYVNPATNNTTQIGTCSGDFNCVDTAGIADLSNLAVGLNDIVDITFLTGIATDLGDVSFILDKVTLALSQMGNLKKADLILEGYFANASGKVLGNGLLTTQKISNANTTYSATIATDVPTPAAVLPVLGGLLGFASKRKQREENA